MIPDYSAPLIGWRGWHFSAPQKPTRRRIRLLSTGVSQQHCWKPKKISEARCVSFSDPKLVLARHHSLLKTLTPTSLKVPVQPCTCGIYAMASFENLVKYQGYGASLSEGVILGPVALWGKIIKHTYGYRAQYAYPLAFFIDPYQIWTRRGKPFATRVARCLSRDYGVPATLMETDVELDQIRKITFNDRTWLYSDKGDFDRSGRLTNRWPPRLINAMKNRLIQPYTSRMFDRDNLMKLLS